MPRLSQATKDVRKDAILAAARKLLVRRNFDDVCMAEIASEARVAKGTLFLYFPNKEDLFSAVYLSLFDALGAKYDALIAENLPPAKLLRKTALVMMDHFERNKDFTERFRAGRFNTEKTAELMARTRTANLARLVRIMEICAAGGFLEDFDNAYAASALFGLCRGAIVHKRITGRKLGHEDFADRILHIFIKGIGKK
jgi:AcrR family transcriptional regulator